MPRIWGKLVDIDTALKRVLEHFTIKPSCSSIDLDKALGLVSCEDIVSPIDIPLYDTSAVDGYAVKAEDIVGASPSNPIRLRVKGLVTAGDPPDVAGPVGPGEAVEVYTGAPLPPGANAVVMYEDTSRINGYVEVYRSIPIYGNVTRRGDDVRAGSTIVERRKLLTAYDLALLTAVGSTEIKVYRRINIGIISIGNELIESSKTPLSPGKKYSYTDILVEKYLDTISFVNAHRYGVIGDSVEELAKAFDRMAGDNDILVTIGGTSVSERDIVPDYVESYGRWVIHGIALRPGRTTSVADVDGKPLFVLSGNPVAAWVGLEALLRPFLYRIHGLEPPPRPWVKAKLTRRVPNPIGFRSFVRVFVYRKEDSFYTEPYMVKGSSVLSSLARTQGYIVIPEDLEGYEEGEIVRVNLFTLS